jgi:hypothetical protein
MLDDDDDDTLLFIPWRIQTLKTHTRVRVRLYDANKTIGRQTALG